MVHTHTAKAGFLGRTAAFLEKVPIIVHTFHGHLLTGYFSFIKTSVFTATERFLAKFSTALVSVGERVRNDLVEAKIGKLEQYVAIPPGVILGVIPERNRARQELNIGPEIFSSLASLEFSVQFGHALSFGILYGSFQSFKHGFKQFFLVFLEL